MAVAATWDSIRRKLGPGGDPMSSALRGERALVGLLSERGLLSAAQILEIERDAARWGAGFTETLLARGLVYPEVLAETVAVASGLPLLDGSLLPLDPQFAEAQDIDFFVAHHVMPWRRERGVGIVAVVNPYTAERTLKSALGDEPFAMHVTTRRNWTEGLLAAFSESAVSEAIGGLPAMQPEFSAKSGLTFQQALATFVLFAAIGWGLAKAPNTAWTIIAATTGVFFIATTLFRVFLMGVGLWPHSRGAHAGSHSDPSSLPHYSILVALYDEAPLVAQTVRALGRLNYPWTKLDILLLLEQSDSKTRAACAALPLDGRFTILTVPDRRPRTKPKACNFGLRFGRGDFIALYDAEDRPDPDQLLTALDCFSQCSADVACLQARLNFYNARENWLTSQFALEFAVWFQFIMPGLERLRLPIPLGGTSNHFRREALRALGGWDAYNVTEDADIGIRLARRGLRTRTIASTTAEEANVAVPNWIHQRSRWLKGYLQTYIVHMREPSRLWRELGPMGFLSFQLLLGGAVVSPVLHLAFWIALFAHLAGAPLMVGLEWPLLFAPWNLFVILIGNGAAIASGLIAAAQADFRGLGRPSLAMGALSMPLYWFLISFAVFKGVFSYFSRPFYWAKTRHGLSRVSPADFRARQDVEGRIMTRARSGQA